MKKQVEEVHTWESAMSVVVIDAAIEAVCSKEVMQFILQRTSQKLLDLFGGQMPPNMDSVRMCYDEGKTQIKKAEFISEDQANAINACEEIHEGN